MTNCTQESFDLPSLKRQKIEAKFSSDDITSECGVLLLREIDGSSRDNLHLQPLHNGLTSYYVVDLYQLHFKRSLKI